MKCDLVFKDWRMDGHSIYHTELGLKLSTGDLHSGSMFKGAVEFPDEIRQEVQDAWNEHRAYPIFMVIPPPKNST